MKLKITALFAVALLLCSALVGCSKPDNSENGNDPVPGKGVYSSTK